MFVVGEHYRRAPDDEEGSTLAYDFTTQQWDKTTYAKRPHPGNHHAVEVSDGKVILLGGLSSGSNTKM